MDENRVYTNKQGDIMLDIPYFGSEAYKCVQYCSQIERLKNRLSVTLEAIEYWKAREDEIQISFFQQHLEHINQKMFQLGKNH